MPVVMDHGWIVTHGGQGSALAQVSFASEGGSGAPVPDLSIEVDNLQEVLERMHAAGIALDYGPADEPWGVRRLAAAPSVPTGPGGEPVNDSFFFVHRTLTGNGSITVPVTSLTGVIDGQAGEYSGTQPWAKAGVIMKENLSPGSPYAAVLVTPGHGARMQYDYTRDIAGLRLQSEMLRAEAGDLAQAGQNLGYQLGQRDFDHGAGGIN